MEHYPKFQIREAMAIPGEGDMVEVVMWYNHNQAIVFGMSKDDLRVLEDKIVEFMDYLKPEIGHHRQQAAREVLGIDTVARNVPPPRDEVWPRG